MAYVTTLDVRTREHAFQLTNEDAILLFKAKVDRGIDFDFASPGHNKPIRIELNGLHTRTTKTFVPD